MLRQYFQQHIVDRAVGDGAVSVLLPSITCTKPGDSTKQLPRKVSSAAATDSAGSSTGAGANPPATKSRASPGAPLCGSGCRRGRATPIHIDPALDLSAAIRDVGVRTEGFSGRELSKLVLKMQVRGFLSFGWCGWGKAGPVCSVLKDAGFRWYPCGCFHQGAVYGTESLLLTKELFDSVVAVEVEKHVRREGAWVPK
jgi:hypothetical protein